MGRTRQMWWWLTRACAPTSRRASSCPPARSTSPGSPSTTRTARWSSEAGHITGSRWVMLLMSWMIVKSHKWYNFSKDLHHKHSKSLDFRITVKSRAISRSVFCLKNFNTKEGGWQMPCHVWQVEEAPSTWNGKSLATKLDSLSAPAALHLRFMFSVGFPTENPWPQWWGWGWPR